MEKSTVQAVMTFILATIDSVIINFPVILAQHCHGKRIIIPRYKCNYFCVVRRRM